MGRNTGTIKKADIARAVSGARAGGISIAKIEIDTKTGRITIMAGECSTPSSNYELDQELAAFERHNENQTKRRSES
jgi:hypothetical protein